MKRQAIVLLAVTWLIVDIGLMPPNSRTWGAEVGATLKSVTLSDNPAGTELDLRVDGNYDYKTVQARPDSLFIDLAGVKAEGVARSQQWANPVFSGYKLLAFLDDSGQPVVRLQMEMKQASPFVVQKDGSKLRLVVGKGQFVSAAAGPVPATKPQGPSAHLVPVAPPKGALADVVPLPHPGGLLLVSKVTFDKHESGETFVDVATSRGASYRVTTLPNPARLVVDIDGAENTSPQKSYQADTAVLKAVRIGQFRAGDPSIVRVVADLNGDPAFDVQATPAGVRIELHPRGRAKSAPIATPAPAPQVKPVKTKPPEAVASAPSPVTIAKETAPVHFPEVVDRRPAVAATPAQLVSRDASRPDVQSTLPASIRPQQVAAAPLPPPASATPEALRAEHAAQTLIPGKDGLPMAAQAGPPATGINPGQETPPPTAINPGQESKPVYTGEPISLNLKDVDLKDFFRLIHEISGLNIIIDPNVTGSVTLVLDSVPWDQALDIVLKNNDLGKVLEGNVLRIARMQTLTAEQEGVTKLAAARMDAAPLVTVFRPINYAKATEIMTLLKTWTGGGALTRRGNVLVDVRSNTLIISDVQTQMPIIMNILSKIDKKAKQVSIEARVVLANADFTRTLSSALSGTVGNNSGSTLGGGSTGSNSSITPTNTVPGATPPLNGLTIPPSTSTGFGAIAITNASSRYLINAVITAQEERDQAKTISRPTIVTQNNVQGMVQQGVQVPIQTTINNTISVQYYNATLQLTVTPQVTDDNNIFLIINVLNNSVGASISGVGPEINTQQATTSVLVPDGGTVVFGGITVTSRAKSATYIPLLGNIPVIGHLFKNSNVQDQDQELLFFVSPKVLTT
ncbi:MAG: type IV pilus secretin PilQ [Terriglobia bacterium]|jgi:type IV pilus assembly protein PilQ